MTKSNLAHWLSRNGRELLLFYRLFLPHESYTITRVFFQCLISAISSADINIAQMSCGLGNRPIFFGCLKRPPDHLALRTPRDLCILFYLHLYRSSTTGVLPANNDHVRFQPRRRRDPHRAHLGGTGDAYPVAHQAPQPHSLLHSGTRPPGRTTRAVPTLLRPPRVVDTRTTRRRAATCRCKVSLVFRTVIPYSQYHTTLRAEVVDTMVIQASFRLITALI